RIGLYGLTMAEARMLPSLLSPQLKTAVSLTKQSQAGCILVCSLIPLSIRSQCLSGRPWFSRSGSSMHFYETAKTMIIGFGRLASLKFTNYPLLLLCTVYTAKTIRQNQKL